MKICQSVCSVRILWNMDAVLFLYIYHIRLYNVFKYYYLNVYFFHATYNEYQELF